MKRTAWMLVGLAVLGTAGGTGYFSQHSLTVREIARTVILTGNAAESKQDPIIYYRDPAGAPFYSLTPKKTNSGKDYLAVRSGEDDSVAAPFESISNAAAKPQDRRILYYRNPMGLPDTSPSPKKDSMGMDYIPVYASDGSGDSTIKVSVGKLQRSGARSEPAIKRMLSTVLHASGLVKIDERRQAVVSLRFEGWIEKVEDVTTGAVVRKGQPLMRVYGSSLSAAAADYVSTHGLQSGNNPSYTGGSRQRLDNLGVPAEIIKRIETSGKVPLTVTWPAPRDGIVLERNATDGQRVQPGDVLFRLADISSVWVLADIPERDLPHVAIGQSATVRPRGYPDRVFNGKIDLIYPEINMVTRTARVRIELVNEKELLMPNMFADVDLGSDSATPVLSVPDSAVIDSGTQRVVLVDKGEGRFEPRTVKTGQRGGGFVEIRDGLAENERVVVSATFLIDAESNLNSALNGLAQGGKTP